MLQDREMTMDALDAVKHDILDLTRAAEECSDEKLRQSLLQFRNDAEQTQMKLSSVATEKGWYVSSPMADEQQIQELKSKLHQEYGSSSAQGRDLHVRF